MYHFIPTFILLKFNDTGSGGREQARVSSLEERALTKFLTTLKLSGWSIERQKKKKQTNNKVNFLRRIASR